MGREPREPTRFQRASRMRHREPEPGQRSKTLKIEGNQIQVTPEDTVTDLRDMVGANPDDVATYVSGDGDVIALGNRDRPYYHVPPDTNLSFQAGTGTLFG